MAGFRFRLQSVLDYRRTLVDRTQMEVAALRQRQRQEEEILEALRASERTTLARLQRAQQATLDRPTLTHLLDHIQVLTARIAEQESVVELRRREADELQEKLVGLAKEAKALEKLRQRQEEVYAQESLRQERLESSEAAALQYRRLRRARA